MKRIGKVGLIVFAFVFAVFPLLSQTPAPAAKKPSFEVVSIKPSSPGLGIRGGGGRGDRMNLVGLNLRALVQQAYSKGQAAGPPGAGQLQILGGPGWVDSDRWDVDAKADCSNGALTREQQQLMMQSMLEDRFQLKVHLETREMPVYNLVVAKDGPKMKKSEDQTPSPVPQGGRPLCAPAPAAPPEGQRAALPPPLPPPPAPGQPFTMPTLPPPGRGQMFMMMSPAGATMQAGAVTIASLIGMLQGQAGRPVFDKTGLTALYDFKLTFLPEAGIGGTPFGPGGPGGVPVAPPGGAAPTAAADPIASLFTAVQEQLGLRLESAKGPVEVVVIDSVQRPTEN